MDFPLAVSAVREPVGAHLEVARNIAWLKRTETGKKWIATYSKLVSYGVQLAQHADARTDLVLRSLEEETARRASVDDTPFDDAFDIQAALTRYWVLSTYEILRIAKDSDIGKGNAKLNELYRRFRLVRVPMGKQEIAGGAKAKGLEMLREGDDPALPGRPYVHGHGWLAQYRPLTFFRADTGAIGWGVADVANQSTTEITRRQLSDELLALFD